MILFKALADMLWPFVVVSGRIWRSTLTADWSAGEISCGCYAIGTILMKNFSLFRLHKLSLRVLKVFRGIMTGDRHICSFVFRGYIFNLKKKKKKIKCTLFPEK